MNYTEEQLAVLEQEYIDKITSYSRWISGMLVEEAWDDES